MITKTLARPKPTVSAKEDQRPSPNGSSKGTIVGSAYATSSALCSTAALAAARRRERKKKSTRARAGKRNRISW